MFHCKALWGGGICAVSFTVYMSSSSLILNWVVPSTAIAHMVEIATKNKHMFIKESFIFLQIAKAVVLDIENKVCY